MMIKLAICEDQKLMLKGLESLLINYTDLFIVGLFENGQLLLDSIRTSRMVPDVVLMDIDMPVLNGFETVLLLRERHPKVKILILSTHHGASYVENAIQKGAHGYLNKGADPEEIYEAIKEAHLNGCYFNDTLSFSRLQEFINNGFIRPNFTESSELSIREIEVVRCICEEKSTSEIAKQLNLGEHTINSYRKNIMTKIGTKKSIGIVIYAMKNGIFIP